MQEKPKVQSFGAEGLRPQGQDPSGTDRTYRNHTHSIVFIWKKPLFAMFCLISMGFQQEWDYSN